MKSAWRLTLALFVAATLAACSSTDEKDTSADTTPDNDTTTPTEVETAAAPDPRDYSDSRNFDNPESLQSKRVIYFDFYKSTVRP